MLEIPSKIGFKLKSLDMYLIIKLYSTRETELQIENLWNIFEKFVNQNNVI